MALSTALPQLIVDQANLPSTAKQLAEYLAASGRLFERGGQVVRIIDGVEGVRIEPLSAQGVVLEAHEVCRPVKDNTKQGMLVRDDVTLPLPVARLYKEMGGDWGLQILKGICATPLLSSDGTITCVPGYDQPRGVWCVGVNTPDIVAVPSRTHAAAALQLVRRTFSSFPFADSTRVDANGVSLVDISQHPGADESAFLIGLLTAVCRPSLPLAPGLVIRAPHLSGSGTGKGLLVHALSEIAFAQKPTAFTSSGSRNELTKRIESALMKSGPLVFLDNCNGEVLTSNVLAQVITEGQVQCRRLGQSEMVPLTTNAFIAITGNALHISEDLARRFLVVNLDAKCESPEQRHFAENIDALIAANREKLRDSLLAIWRWGRQNPLPPGQPMGSFDVWSRWCRDPLLALGCIDPARRISDLKAADPLRQRVAELLETWHVAHGSRPIKFCDLDPTVATLLATNRQARVARLGELEDARAGGFVLKVIRPRGAWGYNKYFVQPDASNCVV